MSIEVSSNLSSLDTSLDVSGLLFGLSCLGIFTILSYSNLLFSEFNIVFLSIILLEGSGVNVNNGVFDNSLGSDELVVSGVIDDIYDPCLLSDLLGSPGEVSSIDS